MMRLFHNIHQTSQTCEFLSLRQRQRRIFGVTIALIPLVGSVVFNLGVHLPFLGCPLMRYIGIPCPAWGLTRSLMAVVRGDIHQAIAYHLFGLLVFVGFIIATIHLSLELLQNKKLNYFYVRWVMNPKFQVFGFLVLLGYHGVRLQKMWQIGELYPSFLNSPLGNLILNKLLN